MKDGLLWHLISLTPQHTSTTSLWTGVEVLLLLAKCHRLVSFSACIYRHWNAKLTEKLIRTQTGLFCFWPSLFYKLGIENQVPFQSGHLDFQYWAVFQGSQTPMCTHKRPACEADAAINALTLKPARVGRTASFWRPLWEEPEVHLITCASIRCDAWFQENVKRMIIVQRLQYKTCNHSGISQVFMIIRARIEIEDTYSRLI